MHLQTFESRTAVLPLLSQRPKLFKRALMNEDVLDKQRSWHWMKEMQLSWRMHLQWSQLLKNTFPFPFKYTIYYPQPIKPHASHSSTLMETQLLFFRNTRNLCEIQLLIKPISFDNICKIRSVRELRLHLMLRCRTLWNQCKICIDSISVWQWIYDNTKVLLVVAMCDPQQTE